MNRAGGDGTVPTKPACLGALWAFWVEELPFAANYARALSARCKTPADDLLDEGLLRAIGAALRGAGPTHPNRVWLKTTLNRVAVDHYRRRRRFDDVDISSMADSASDDSPTPELDLIQREERAEIAKKLGGLPDAWRRPLELRALDGYSYEKISRKLRITSSNARKRVQLARNSLKVGARP